MQYLFSNTRISKYCQVWGNHPHLPPVSFCDSEPVPMHRFSHWKTECQSKRPVTPRPHRRREAAHHVTQRNHCQLDCSHRQQHVTLCVWIPQLTAMVSKTLRYVMRCAACCLRALCGWGVTVCFQRPRLISAWLATWVIFLWIFQWLDCFGFIYFIFCFVCLFVVFFFLRKYCLLLLWAWGQITTKRHC